MPVSLTVYDSAEHAPYMADEKSLPARLLPLLVKLSMI